MEIRIRTIGGLAGCNDIATSAVTRILLLLGCQLRVTTMNSCRLLCGMQSSVNPILHVHIIHFAFL